MDAEKFIKQQLSMIADDFGLDQIKDNIYRFFVKYHLPNITLDALIHRCMEMYAEIMKRNTTIIEEKKLFKNVIWKNPSEKLPSETKEVILHFKNDVGKHRTGVVFDAEDKLFYDNYDNEYKEAYDSYNIIAWADLPVYN